MMREIFVLNLLKYIIDKCNNINIKYFYFVINFDIEISIQLFNKFEKKLSQYDQI